MSQYNIVCRCFNDNIFEKIENIEQKSILTEDDMKNYFLNFVKELTSDSTDSNGVQIKSKYFFDLYFFK